VHDTADLEARGVPAAFVATLEFEDGAVAQARALGADPAAVYVRHPIQDRTDDEMREIADRALDDVVEALTSAASPERSGV
jgi:hypothetical protein